MTGLTEVCQHPLARLRFMVSDRFAHMVRPMELLRRCRDNMQVVHKINARGLNFLNRVTFEEMWVLRNRLKLDLTVNSVWYEDSPFGPQRKTGFSRRRSWKEVWGPETPEILTFIPDAAWFPTKGYETFISVGNLIWSDPETGDDLGNTYLGTFIGTYKQPKPPKRAKTKRREISYSKRLDVLLRDDKTCQICRCTEGPFHVDHKIPVARGGSNEMSNLWTLCQACNLGKSDRDLDHLL